MIDEKMSDERMRNIASLYYHALSLIEACYGISVYGGRLCMDGYDIVYDYDNGEVTIYEAKKTFNIEGI